VTPAAKRLLSGRPLADQTNFGALLTQSHISGELSAVEIAAATVLVVVAMTLTVQPEKIGFGGYDSFLLWKCETLGFLGTDSLDDPSHCLPELLFG